ncbi:MAG: RICIN domain-containing protein [Acidimicrobiales bacterium]
MPRRSLLLVVAALVSLLSPAGAAWIGTAGADTALVAAGPKGDSPKHDSDDGSEGDSKPAKPPPAVVRSAFSTYRVFATQYAPLTEGSVEVAVPDKCIKFAALRNTTALTSMKCASSYSLGRDYRVVVTRESGPSALLPVKEAGPWNIDDNWWDGAQPAQPRRMFTDLGTGMPESRAAFEKGYNTVEDCKDLEGNPTGTPGGADQFGRCVRNQAGIDLSVAAAKILGLGPMENAWVSVTLLWEPVDVAIVNHRSGLNLDVAGSSKAEGAAALQWTASGSASQRWRLRLGDDDSFAILSVNSGKALAVTDAGQPGAKVAQSAPTASPGQRWRIEPAASGTFTIASSASGQLLDVVEGSVVPGAGVVQWPAGGVDSQRWTLAAAKAEATA